MCALDKKKRGEVGLRDVDDVCEGEKLQNISEEKVYFFRKITFSLAVHFIVAFNVLISCALYVQYII